MAQPGDIIDIWVVEKALGQGGMGSVYRAHNKAATRILAAIKVLDPAMNRMPTGKARFVREAEILFSLDHPNIVKVRNVRMDAEFPYIEMEFVNGESLDGRILRGQTPVMEAVGLVRQAARALVYMHERGIRHRDIKPSNMLVQPDGTLKLVDFGIASDLHGEAITRTDEAFGSVSYAPPEWMDPKRLDPIRWDLYSLGLVLYELLTGSMAFPLTGPGSHRQQAMQVMIAKQNHPPLDPGPEFSEDLRALVRDLTWGDPDKRTGSAGELLIRLDSLVGEESPAIPGPAPAAGAATPTPTWYDLSEESQRPSSVASSPGNTAYDPEAEGWAALGSSSGGSPSGPATQPTPAPQRSRAAPVSSPPVSSPPVSSPPVSSPPTTTELSEGSSSRWPVMVFSLLVGFGVVWAAWGLVNPSPGPGEEAQGGPSAATEPARDLMLVFTGLPAGTPVSAGVGARQAEAAGTEHQRRVEDLPLGRHALRALVGKDCESGLVPQNPVPVWCGLFEQELEVSAGDGEQLVPMALTPPSPVRVQVSAPSLKNNKATLTLDDGQGQSLTRGELSLELLPARYAVRIDAGTCAAQDAGCDSHNSCPPGCSSWMGELIVPWAGADMSLQVPQRAPSAGANSVAVGTGPVETAPSAVGARVTRRQYARWLQDHPDWLPEAALAAGLVNDRYLRDWSEGHPPAGREDAPVQYVPWGAAKAYCASRGGLPDISAEPLTWQEESPWMEYRQSGGRPAWRRSDGTVSEVVDVKEATRSAEFRCAR